MKAVIMEATGKKAVALCKDGTFRTIANRNYKTGQTVSVPSGTAAFRRAAVLIPLALLLGSISGISAYAWYSPYSTVKLGKESAVTYTLNRFDRVIGVKAESTEGSHIISGIEKNLYSEKISDAVDITIQQMKKEEKDKSTTKGSETEEVSENPYTLQICSQTDEKLSGLVTELTEQVKSAASEYASTQKSKQKISQEKTGNAVQNVEKSEEQNGEQSKEQSQMTNQNGNSEKNNAGLQNSNINGKTNTSGNLKSSGQTEEKQNSQTEAGLETDTDQNSQKKSDSSGQKTQSQAGSQGQSGVQDQVGVQGQAGAADTTEKVQPSGSGDANSQNPVPASPGGVHTIDGKNGAPPASGTLPELFH
jgi:hypothetical protein